MAYKKTPETEEILENPAKGRSGRNRFRTDSLPVVQLVADALRAVGTAPTRTRPNIFTMVVIRAWNTFETRGKCPDCAHQWRWTSCLRCEGWSRHEDWYVKKDSA